MQHTWRILELKRTISDGVVNTVNYGCFSEHEEERTRTINQIEISGSADDSGFIAYDDLTENTVLGWVYSNVSQSEIESSNSASIADRVIAKAAVTEANGIPWGEE